MTVVGDGTLPYPRIADALSAVQRERRLLIMSYGLLCYLILVFKIIHLHTLELNIMLQHIPKAMYSL